MGVGKLPDYTAELVSAGMDPETPVALVERATWPDMRVATGTLETIVDVRDAEGIEPPAITVIGAVAATRDRVRGFLRNEFDEEHASDRNDREKSDVETGAGDDDAGSGADDA
jgi:uroporphyrin-III C-methyltransferase